MRKKFYVLVMGVLCAGLILGSIQAFAQEKIVLRTIGGPDPEGIETGENDLFEKAYPWIKIERTTVPYGIEKRMKLIASFRAVRPYDMYKIDCVEVPEYAAANWALDVTDWVTEKMKEAVLPFAADGMMYQGRWYGLAFPSSWKSFIYNERMLKQAGFARSPETWDEFVDQSKKLQAAEIVGKRATAWSWAQKECLICDFVAIVASFGGEFFDGDLNPKFNGEAGVEALQWMVDSIYKYRISDLASLTFTEPDVDALMQGGKIAFQLRWAVSAVPLNNPEISKVVGECRVGLFPAKTREMYPGYTVSGSMGWSIAPASRYQKDAWEYLQFRCGFVGNKRNALKYGKPPSWAPLFEDPFVTNAMPELDLRLAKQIVNRPRVPWYYKFSDALQLELQKALTREKSPKQALDDAASKAMEIKREAK